MPVETTSTRNSAERDTRWNQLFPLRLFNFFSDRFHVARRVIQFRRKFPLATGQFDQRANGDDPYQPSQGELEPVPHGFGSAISFFVVG